MRRYLYRLDLVALLAFAALMTAVLVAPVNHVDAAILHAVQRGTSFDGVMHFVSWFGYRPMGGICPLVILALLLLARWRRDAVFFVVTVLGSWALSTCIHLLSFRHRPDAALVREALSTSSSFPSGHVTSYVAMFGAIAIILKTRLPHSRVARALMWLAIALIALVGLSRLYLGAHWASDVLGGYLLGGMWLTFAARVYREPPNTAPRSMAATYSASE